MTAISQRKIMLKKQDFFYLNLIECFLIILVLVFYGLN